MHSLLKTGLLLFPLLTAENVNAHAVTPGDHLVTNNMVQLSTRVEGRVDARGLEGSGQRPDGAATRWMHAWPGVYWEARFKGPEVTLAFNDTINQYRVYIDGKEITTISKPGSRDYRIDGLGPDAHDIHLEKFSENQGEATAFDGFFAPAGMTLTIPHSSPNERQIEFIGDSYTVGYGNTAGKRQCTQDELWAATDTSQAFGPLTARHYQADYQINAFSGRGIVRNYDGFAGDTLPGLYPYTLYDGKTLYDAAAAGWHPQAIVIALGTNDFSTPVHAGEKWKTEAALTADYEATYVGFVKSLRAQNPDAVILLISYDTATTPAITRVRDQLTADGDRRVNLLEITGFNKNACDSHPDTGDHRKISQALIDWFDTHAGLWPGK